MTEQLPRNAPPDMSSEAIDQRLREVSDLRSLGLSLLRARRISRPPLR